MRDKLIQLKNTLGMVETKAESTLIMADCIRFLDTCIKECSVEMTERNDQNELQLDSEIQE